MHPPEDERLVERPDRAARDHIEDLHLALVVDHREVLDEVTPGPPRPDDPGPVDPDQPVLHHLAADGIKERPAAGKDPRSLDHLPNAGDLDLAVLDRNRRHLVREHIGSPGWRDDPLALVRPRPACDHERLQEIVKPRGKDGPARDGIETVAGPADPLDQARDLSGGAELDDVFDMPDIDPEFHRGCGDECPDLALPEPFLGIDPDVP